MLKPQNLEGLTMVANKRSDHKVNTIDHKRVDRLRVPNQG